MPSRSKVLSDGAIGRQKPLRMTGGFEPLHAILPVAGGLMGVLRTVIEIPVLAMLYTWQALALRRAIAFELLRNDDPRHVGQAFEECADKLLRRPLVPAALDENISDVAVRIDGTPQIMACPIARPKHFISMPCVARSG